MLRVLPPIIKPVNMQPDLLQDRFYVGGIARNSAIPLVLRQIARFLLPVFPYPSARALAKCKRYNYYNLKSR